MLDPEQAAIDRIEAVGDVGEQERRVVLQQGGEGVGQHFVGAVADEHLVGPHPVIGRQGLPQGRRQGIWIEPQAVGRLGPDRPQGAGGGAEGALVGVELDQPLDARLLARDIGLQPVHPGAPETAHATAPCGRLADVRRLPRWRGGDALGARRGSSPGDAKWRPGGLTLLRVHSSPAKLCRPRLNMAEKRPHSSRPESAAVMGRNGMKRPPADA